jgi:hypothetical protein
MNFNRINFQTWKDFFITFILILLIFANSGDLYIKPRILLYLQMLFELKSKLIILSWRKT